MSKEQKQSFVKGAAILSISTFIVKILGLAFSIPIANIVSVQGMSYFYTAYDIFLIFMVISSSGIPTAISRMVGTSIDAGRKDDAEKVHKVALYCYLIIGFVGMLIMSVFAEQTAGLMGNPNAKLSIVALAPTTFFISIASIYRGYFQGKSNMIPSGVSQIIEATTKVFIGVSLAIIVLRLTSSDELTSAAAITAVPISSFFAVVFLIYYKFKQNKREAYKFNKKNVTLRTKSIVIELFRFSIPIIIGVSLLQIIDAADMVLVMNRLQDSVGMTIDQAEWARGVLGHTRKFFDLPTSFIMPLAISLLPVLSVAIINNRQKDVKRYSNNSIKLTILFAMPATIGMIIFAKPICELLLINRPEAVASTAELLSVISIAVVINSSISITTAILNSFAKTTIPIRNVLIGGVIKLMLTYILVGIPEINVMGSAISTVISYTIMLILNVFSVKKLLPDMNGYFKTLFKPLLSSVAMGIGSYAFYLLLTMFIPSYIAIIPSIFVALALYVLFAIIFKALAYDDIIMLPKGKTLARILKIKKTELDIK